MSIIDLLRERKSQRKYYASKSLAEEYFVKQKNALNAIKDTDWFNEIKMFFERDVETCVNRLETTKKGELPWVQAELKQARKFLDFLSNLTEE